RESALYERLVVLKLLIADYEGAKQRCEEWQRLEPRSARPVWVRGKIAADEDQLEEAERLLAQAVAGEPDNMDYAVTLADVLIRRGSQPALRRPRELLERAAARPPVEAKTY